jgi:hypothetical protein
MKAAKGFITSVPSAVVFEKVRYKMLTGENLSLFTYHSFESFS